MTSDVVWLLHIMGHSMLTIWKIVMSNNIFLSIWFHTISCWTPFFLKINKKKNEVNLIFSWQSQFNKQPKHCSNSHSSLKATQKKHLCIISLAPTQHNRWDLFLILQKSRSSFICTYFFFVLWYFQKILVVFLVIICLYCDCFLG